MFMVLFRVEIAFEIFRARDFRNRLGWYSGKNSFFQSGSDKIQTDKKNLVRRGMHFFWSGSGLRKFYFYTKIFNRTNYYNTRYFNHHSYRNMYIYMYAWMIIRNEVVHRRIGQINDGLTCEKANILHKH